MKTAVVYLSKKGMKELKKQITRLEQDRQAILTSLRELDKTESHEGRLERVDKIAQLDIVESELADKQQALASAKRLPRKRDALKVAIGSVVDLIDTNGKLMHYTLVESIEANPSDGRISIKSPLGQSLLGKQVQDVIEWSTGMQTNRCQLVSIR